MRARRSLRLASLLPLLRLVAGCATPFVAACATTHTAVRDLAARELACPPDAIDISRAEGKHAYRAAGCGADVRIACYDPHESTGAEWGWADPLTSGNRVRCERILDRPTTTTGAPLGTSASAASAGQAGGSSATEAAFDKALAAKLLTAAVDRARTCSVPGGVDGQGRAHVTFAGDGRVSAVDVDAPFRDTEVGRCVARELERTSLTPFSGGPVTVAKSFDVPRPSVK